MATTTTQATFETGHADMVHDVAWDYYGKRVATCSSDRMIKVFDVLGGQITHLADLSGHQGPVWQVSWAHPKFGSLLASCSYDNCVIIWREVSTGVWQQVYASPLHAASVNSVAWAPHELGLALATASSDGALSILTNHPDGSWAAQRIEGAHPVGANAVSWCPATPPGSLPLSSSSNTPAAGTPQRRLASCGCDGALKIWYFEGSLGQWQEEQGSPLTGGHSDWIRDVAWAPNLGLPKSTIATAGQDGRLMVWNEKSRGQWENVLVKEFEGAVWRVNWSVSGNLLSASDASGNVTLWKEVVDGKWQQIVQ